MEGCQVKKHLPAHAGTIAAYKKLSYFVYLIIAFAQIFSSPVIGTAVKKLFHRTEEGGSFR